VYKYRNGVLGKNTNQVTEIKPYLVQSKQINKYKGMTSIYYFVTARFMDPNKNAVNFGFTVNACSLNVKLYITKQFEKVNAGTEINYATFFEEFLFRIGYPESVYVTNCRYRTVYRLYALQATVRELIAKGEW
jgi:hypothetical protein